MDKINYFAAFSVYYREKHAEELSDKTSVEKLRIVAGAWTNMNTVEKENFKGIYNQERKSFIQHDYKRGRKTKNFSGMRPKDISLFDPSKPIEFLSQEIYNEPSREIIRKTYDEISYRLGGENAAIMDYHIALNQNTPTEVLDSITLESKNIDDPYRQEITCAVLRNKNSSSNTISGIYNRILIDGESFDHDVLHELSQRTNDLLSGQPSNEIC